MLMPLQEDGVNNEGVDNNSLYTQPEDIWNIYETLSKISPYFSIAAAFGNVHGVYAPGGVRLHPELLAKHQAYVSEKLGGKDKKPVFLVFHGGSGSSKEEYREAISYGVIKVCLGVLDWRDRRPSNNVANRSISIRTFSSATS